MFRYLRKIILKVSLLLSVFCSVSITTINAQSAEASQINFLLNRINQELDNANRQMALSFLDDVIPLIENNDILLAELFWVRGHNLYMEGRFDGAITDLLYSIELNPFFARSHEHLAVIYLFSGQYIDALQTINRAIEIDNLALNFYNIRTAIFMDLEKYDMALEDINFVLSLDPFFSDALANKGTILFNLGNYQKSLYYLDRAIAAGLDFLTATSLKPNVIFRNRGFANFYLLNDEAALHDFTRAIELGSQDPEVFYRRALINWGMDNYHDGYLDISMAIQLSPENIDFYSLRAGYHLNDGNVMMALADILEIFRLLGDEEIIADFDALFDGIYIEDIGVRLFTDKFTEFVLTRDPDIIQRMEHIIGTRIE